MNSSVSWASSLACASPVLTSVPGGRIVWICSKSRCGETPGLAATRIWSSLPSLSKSRCAVARSNPDSVAPPIELTEPNLTSPETVSVSTGPSTWTPILSPTAMSFFPAVDLSITTWFAPGHLPSTRVRLLNCGFDGSTEKPRFGAPPNAIALPSLTSCVFSLATPPIASLTSGRSFTSASNDSSKAASVVPESPPVSKADFGVMVASVLR